jgi:hypothetical protein
MAMSLSFGSLWMFRSVWVWFMLSSRQVRRVFLNPTVRVCIFVVASLTEVLVWCSSMVRLARLFFPLSFVGLYTISGGNGCCSFESIEREEIRIECVIFI